MFIFAILPSWGLSGAAATMVGQNLGAKEPERAQKAVLLTGLLQHALSSAVVVAVFIFMPEALVGFFTADPASDAVRGRLPAHRSASATSPMRSAW